MSHNGNSHNTEKKKQGYLVLDRKVHESIDFYVNDEVIKVSVARITGDYQVRLACKASKNVTILRSEIEKRDI